MENKSFPFQIFIFFTLVFAQVQLQIPPAYIVQNTTGCLFISLSESITDNCSLWILFKKVPLCTLADFNKPVPSVDINQNYKGRIQCSVTESYNQASICFTMGVQSSDAGVYDVRLFKSPDVFITNNTLHVIDQPMKPVISAQSWVVAGDMFTINCSASVSTSTLTKGHDLFYTWFVNKHLVSDHRYTVSGQGGGELTINTVQKQDRGKKIYCIATEDKGISSEPSDEIVLNVLYAPEIVIKPSKNVSVHLNDSNFQFVCYVIDANPPSKLMYIWTKDRVKIGSSQNLTLKTIKRSDQGVYQCLASNAAGTSLPATVFVDVLYAPEIQAFTLIGGQIVNELDKFVIVCSIRSPQPGNISIHNQNTNETVKMGYNVYSVNFIENSAQCFQTTSFVCSVVNTIGTTQSHSLELYVKCRPRSMDDQYFQKLWGKHITFAATYLAYPMPSIAMTFRKFSTAPEVSMSTALWDIAIKPKNISAFSITLKRDFLTTEQFGFYTVNISNDQGFFAATLLIRPKDKPESPQNLSVICSVARTAIISWIPGSERGAQQTFLVSYNTPNERAQDNYTVFGNSLVISNLESRRYIFTITAINMIGQSQSVQDGCTVRDLEEGTSPFKILFGFLFGLFLLISVGQMTFILMTKIRQQKGKMQKLFRKTLHQLMSSKMSMFPSHPERTIRWRSHASHVPMRT